MIQKYLHKALLTLALLALPAASQENSDSSHKFSCIALNELNTENLFYLDGKEFKNLSLRPKMRSRLMPIKKSSVFRLFVESTSEKGKPYYKLVGETTFPTSSNQALFMLNEKDITDEDELPISIKFLDDSIKNFPPGSIKFGNFCPSTLTVKIDKKSSKLDKGKFTVIKTNTDASGGLKPVQFYNNNGQEIHYTRFYIHDNARKMVILTPSKEKRSPLNMTIIPQNLPRKAN